MASNDPLANKVNGYPKFAGQIEIQPELAIFRRFGYLNALNLLYFQAELTSLEEDLQRQQLEDNNSGHPRISRYAWSWYELSTSGNNGDQTQLELIYKLRETLRQYNDAMVQQSRILAYPEPNRWDLTHLQNFLQNMGDPISGKDGYVWGSVSERKAYSPDLITLCPRQKEDIFSNWVVENALCCLGFKKPSRRHGVIGYEDSAVFRITHGITTILASLIPIASITVLYCIHSMPERLGAMCAFSVLLSLCLIIFTNATRTEVFAITAAFAAVQVVFVSTNRD